MLLIGEGFLTQHQDRKYIVTCLLLIVTVLRFINRLTEEKIKQIQGLPHDNGILTCICMLFLFIVSKHSK